MGHGLHVIHDGSRSAPPLLLLHGSGAGSACWGPVIPALARHRHVIRVDLPGCGKSPPAASYAVPAQADAVAAVLDDLGPRPVTVAGHSSGGYVATALAERRPDLVGALTLVSTGPDLTAFRPQPLILRALLSPPLGPLLWRMRSDAVIRRGIASTCARPVHIPDDMIAELRGITFPVLSAVLRESTSYLAERGVPERLAALGIQALVVFGAADPRWEPASAYAYGKVEMLPAVGHLPMLEDPDSTADLLLTAG
jgi:pimeloyl-ACP methyl ester carboxylesterase